MVLFVKGDYVKGVYWGNEKWLDKKGCHSAFWLQKKKSNMLKLK